MPFWSAVSLVTYILKFLIEHIIKTQWNLEIAKILKIYTICRGDINSTLRKKKNKLILQKTPVRVYGVSHPVSFSNN